MLNGEAADEAAQALAQAQQEQIAAMFDAWKDRDPDALAEVYGKEAILNSDDELNSKLFTEPGPRHDCRSGGDLETEGENTFFLAVGRPHGGPGRRCVRLKELGYTVRAGTLNTRIKDMGRRTRTGAAAGYNKPSCQRLRREGR